MCAAQVEARIAANASDDPGDPFQFDLSEIAQESPVAARIAADAVDDSGDPFQFDSSQIAQESPVVSFVRICFRCEL